MKWSVLSQALVAHTCNPRYSGGRDQEDHSSKPVHKILSWKKPSQKKKKKTDEAAQVAREPAACFASMRL
jgi:hypothetical protein